MHQFFGTARQRGQRAYRDTGDRTGDKTQGSTTQTRAEVDDQFSASGQFEKGAEHLLERHERVLMHGITISGELPESE
ncbi:hypothetical protein KCU90_g2282, partial [Aureobasidium melanogenum]